MRPIDDELVDRAIAWCRQADRQAPPEEVRAALGALGWDELLAARALLADPPPARPLGPRALADIARGTLPAVAAEREKEGKYHREGVHGTAPGAPLRGAKDAGKERRRSRGAGAPVIRRKRDRVEAARPEPAGLPWIDELLASEGRAVLERLVRENGARRGRIVAALAEAWRRPDGSQPADEDLSRLLDVHGLSRGFERRERDELLYALRAAAGSRTRAAAALGLTPAALDASLERLAVTQQAQSIEAAHREELRRRATLSERVRLLVSEADRLTELGLMAEVEADVRQRLPHHLRALRASGATPLAAALARSLAVAPPDAEALVTRLGLEVDLHGVKEDAHELPARAASSRPRPGGRPWRSATAPSLRDRPPAKGMLARSPASKSPARRVPPGDRTGGGGARRRLEPSRGGASPQPGKPKPGGRAPARSAKRGAPPRRS
jgi:hypothetical protein